MLTRDDIARSSWGEGAQPRGFLSASALGLEPNSEPYRAELDVVLAQVVAELEDYGLTTVTTLTPKQRRGALGLAKRFAAEGVLLEAQTGSVKDPEGASVSLSASDLAHWEALRARGDAEAVANLGALVKAPPGSAVMFARVRLTGGGLSGSTKERRENWRHE